MTGESWWYKTMWKHREWWQNQKKKYQHRLKEFSQQNFLPCSLTFPPSTPSTTPSSPLPNLVFADTLSLKVFSLKHSSRISVSLTFYLGTHHFLFLVLFQALVNSAVAGQLLLAESFPVVTAGEVQRPVLVVVIGWEFCHSQQSTPTFTINLL